MWRKLVLTFVLLIMLVAPVWAGGWRVLFISSYHPGFPTFFQQTQGLRSELEPAGALIDVEFMDTKRFSGPENLARFLDMLRFKLSRVEPYDVVVVADDAALKFAVEQRASLFPQSSVVFCGVNNQDFARSLSGTPFFTGVIESVSMRETLEEARAQNNQAALRALEADIQAEQNTLLSALQTAFKQTDYHNAANLVRQGRFLNKLRQEIQAAQ